MTEVVIAGYVRSPFTPANRGELAKTRPEVDTALTARNGTPSRALPIAGAKLTVASQEHSANAEAGAKAVTFHAQLPEGPTQLQAWFTDRAGKDLCGAFYATIHRLP